MKDKKMKRCKICAHDTAAIFDRQFKMDYYLCPNCEFMFRDETQIPSPEREKAEYLTHQNTLGNEGYVNMLREFIHKTVTPFQPEPTGGGKRNALDFGSGPGDCVLAHLLREENGYDVDIYDVYFAPGKIYMGKSYDLITCTEVPEHLNDPPATLRLLKKHLKPGGILALTTLFHPIAEDNPAGEEQFQDWWYRRDITHTCFYRPKTFRFIAGLLEMKVLMMDGRNCISLQKQPGERKNQG
ncbi:MAG: class I SAM-dependent methyltransferase [bacterium]|nr:class I SAM-dependent methyltransferase [bacterium]